MLTFPVKSIVCIHSTGELYGKGNGGYGSPQGIDFNRNSNQVQDDPAMHDYNLEGWMDRC
jgi:hypothetical protein